MSKMISIRNNGSLVGFSSNRGNDLHDTTVAFANFIRC